MKARLLALARRRNALLETIAAQRLELSTACEPLQTPLAIFDTGLKIARFVYQHPAWLIGGIAGLMAWRRKGIIGLAREGRSWFDRYSSSLSFGLKCISLVTRPRSESCHPPEH